ncbi:MAG: LamG-like jellyroll fold domain-containing protein, partial [Promethearchaeota archaeon]
MAYKRYIKRGDKVYGPYVYHSRKVNGKVISEYHGTSKKVEKRKKQRNAINSLKFVGIIVFSLFLIYLAFISTSEELRIENFLGERFSITGYTIGADECGTISTPGRYTLNDSVSSSGTCFIINSDDVILDCNNFWINYSSGGGSGQYGVYAGIQLNVTVRNCNIIDAYWAGGVTSDRYGIYLNGVNDSVLENNFVNTYNSTSIYLNVARNNTLINNNGTVVGSGSSITGTGINLWVSSDNNLTNNFGMAIRETGIRLTYSNNNTLTNNTGIGRGNVWDASGIFIQLSSYNNLTNNTGIGEYLPGISISSSNNNRLVNNSGSATLNGTGIMLSTNVSYNVLINNTGTAYGTLYTSAGIMLSNNASYNNLTGNIGRGENQQGLYVLTNGINNIITNNTFRSNGDEVVKISTNCSNNTFTNNTMISENGAGKLLLVGTSSTGNLVYYNNFTETTGLYVENSYSNNDTLYNTTVGGVAKGNYYFNISSLNITDSDNDGWGDSGSDYPLDETTWPSKWYGYSPDWGPYISEPDSTAPTITWEIPTPTDGDSTTDDFTYLNTTINDSSETSAWFDWNKSLLGYWSFDYYNSTHVYDNSSYDNSGFFQGGLGTDNLTTGKRGNALDFDGTNDSVNLGNWSIAGDQMTITAWIRSDNLSNCNYSQCRVISKANATNDTDHYWMISGNDAQTLRFRLRTEDNTSVLYGKNNILQNNVWAHIAAVYNSTHMLLYTDGMLVGNMSKTGNLNVNDSVSVWIGDNPSGMGSRPWDGLIDEVMIFNRSLSPEEINATYNNSKYRLYNNFTNLLEKTYNYSAYAIDEYGNINITSFDRQVTIDTTNPIASFGTNPVNYSNESSSVTFELSCLDNTDVDTLILYGNWTGTWHANSTNSSAVNASVWSISVNNIPEGYWRWGVWCNDTSSRTDLTDVNRTFTVDASSPGVEIVSPTS